MDRLLLTGFLLQVNTLKELDYPIYSHEHKALNVVYNVFIHLFPFFLFCFLNLVFLKNELCLELKDLNHCCFSPMLEHTYFLSMSSASYTKISFILMLYTFLDLLIKLDIAGLSLFGSLN